MQKNAGSPLFGRQITRIFPKNMKIILKIPAAMKREKCSLPTGGKNLRDCARARGTACLLLFLLFQAAEADSMTAG